MPMLFPRPSISNSTLTANPEKIMLKNGKEYDIGIVASVKAALSHGLETSNPKRAYFVDVVKKSRLSAYQWQVPGAENYFKMIGFIDWDNQLRSYIKDIILCCTEGEEAELRVVDPTVEAPAQATITTVRRGSPAA